MIMAAEKHDQVSRARVTARCRDFNNGMSCMLQEHMRLEALKKEEAELTFKPRINKYHDVRPQLNLRHPEAYLAQVQAKRQAQLLQRLEERRLAEVRLTNLSVSLHKRSVMPLLRDDCKVASI